MRIQIHTLGCKMNFVDSERLAKELGERGYQIEEDNPDWVVVNTCTVTHSADKKSAIKIRNAFSRTQNVIITGCGARTDHDFWKQQFPKVLLVPQIEEVIKIITDKESDQSTRMSSSSLPVFLGRTRRYVAIQNGCDTYCSYCIIPFARGKSESREKEAIVKEILNLELQGGKEVVLTGINLAAWGATHTRKPEENCFAHLLKYILERTSIPRIRISSVGPEFLGDEFFDVYANERICDHLHVSVQSGSEKVLKLMNRGHGVASIEQVAHKARKVRPDTALTSDIIVGFPGEGEREFKESEDLMRRLAFSKLHVFPFSLRQGTAAEHLKEGLVSEQEKKKRSAHLRAVGEDLLRDFYRSQLGKTKSVLWEGKGVGLSTNFVRVRKEGAEEGGIEEVLINEQLAIINKD